MGTVRHPRFVVQAIGGPASRGHRVRGPWRVLDREGAEGASVVDQFTTRAEAVSCVVLLNAADRRGDPLLSKGHPPHR